MNNFISLFNNVHDKFSNIFYKEKDKNKKNEDYYLNIIYSLKKITLSKFAEVAKITKPAATQIINKYITKGYVIKKNSEQDRRVCYIELSEQLKKHLQDFNQKLNEFYSDCLSFLSNEELTQLKSILLKIDQNLQ